jgi:hypothetical protein
MQGPRTLRNAGGVPEMPLGRGLQILCFQYRGNPLTGNLLALWLTSIRERWFSATPWPPDSLQKTSGQPSGDRAEHPAVRLA